MNVIDDFCCHVVYGYCHQDDSENDEEDQVKNVDLWLKMSLLLSLSLTVISPKPIVKIEVSEKYIASKSLIPVA